MKNLEKYSPYVLALLRIVAAYMFILHGTAKFWELALLYSLVFFYFVFAGAGAFSLDNRKR